MNLGEAIKTARLAAGMTQAELGEAIGVSGVAIMRYEKGKREPKLEILSSIAKALDISFIRLFRLAMNDTNNLESLSQDLIDVYANEINCISANDFDEQERVNINAHLAELLHRYGDFLKKISAINTDPELLSRIQEYKNSGSAELIPLAKEWMYREKASKEIESLVGWCNNAPFHLTVERKRSK